MNWDIIEGKWKQTMADVKTKWAKLTDDDLKTVGGKRDHLLGKIQERYGVAKDQAEKELSEFERNYRDPGETSEPRSDARR